MKNDVSYKDIILKLLNAIDFSDDKEKFVNEFVELTQIETLTILIQLLSPEEQEKIKSEFNAHAQEQERIKEIFKTHFSEEQVMKASQEAAENAIRKWMTAIEATLSDAQKQKLVALSSELQNASQ